MFLTDEQKNKYKIMSRHACERYCKQKHKKSSMIISIRSSWDKEMPKVFKSEENNVKYILSLAFDDVEYEDDPRFIMTKEDGKEVADFINKHYNDVDTIIIHCDGGISRSAGVGAAIMRVKEGDDFPIFDNQKKHPNMTCYLRTLKAFGYELLR